MLRLTGALVACAVALLTATLAFAAPTATISASPLGSPVPVVIAPGGSQVFTFTNTSATGSTAALAATLNPTNTGFSIGTDGCSGVALGPAKSCQVTVNYASTTTPTSDVNGSLTVGSQKAGKNDPVTVSFKVAGPPTLVIDSFTPPTPCIEGTFDACYGLTMHGSNLPPGARVAIATFADTCLCPIDGGNDLRAAYVIESPVVGADGTFSFDSAVDGNIPCQRTARDDAYVQAVIGYPNQPFVWSNRIPFSEVCV